MQSIGKTPVQKYLYESFKKLGCFTGGIGMEPRDNAGFHRVWKSIGNTAASIG
jgi:hypothetical protein